MKENSETTSLAQGRINRRGFISAAATAAFGVFFQIKGLSNLAEIADDSQIIQDEVATLPEDQQTNREDELLKQYNISKRTRRSWTVLGGGTVFTAVGLIGVKISFNRDRGKTPRTEELSGEITTHQLNQP